MAGSVQGPRDSYFTQRGKGPPKPAGKWRARMCRLLPGIMKVLRVSQSPVERTASKANERVKELKRQLGVPGPSRPLSSVPQKTGAPPPGPSQPRAGRTPQGPPVAVHTGPN